MTEKYDFDDLKAFLPPAEEQWDTEAAWQRLSARTHATAPQRSFRPMFVAAAATFVLALGGSLIWNATHPASRPDFAMQEYTTAAGERSRVTLADGTIVELAPLSTLRIPTQFGRKDRHTYLNGEAFFTVVHNAERPFYVHVRNAETRVLGTSFDVRAYSDAAGVEVVVATGRVSLSAPDAPRGAVLTPGQAGTLRADGTLTVRNAVVTDETAWREGKLAFRDAPFSNVARALEHWYGIDIQVADAALAATHVTAQFTGQSRDEVIDVLAATLSAEVERAGNRITFRRK